MNFSSIPRSIINRWASAANSSYVRSIPDTGSTGGAAAYDVGFPPATFQSQASGGTPPDGRDMNGILEDLSSWAQWAKAGSPVVYDSAFASAVGGYPKYAILSSTTSGVIWQNTTDGNTSNPDSGGTGWLRFTSGLTQQIGNVRATISGGSNYTVTFPSAFPNACSGVFMTPVNTTSSASRDNFLQLVSRTATGFTYNVQAAQTGGDNNLDGIDWLAFGN